MVCKKCEKVCRLHPFLSRQSQLLMPPQKVSVLAAPDPFQPSSSTRKIGENKLLSNRARASPYARGMNKGRTNPYGKCLDCKVSSS